MKQEIKNKIIHIIKNPLFIPIAIVSISLMYLTVAGLLAAWAFTLGVWAVILVFVGFIWIGIHLDNH